MCEESPGSIWFFYHSGHLQSIGIFNYSLASLLSQKWNTKPIQWRNHRRQFDSKIVNNSRPPFANSQFLPMKKIRWWCQSSWFASGKRISLNINISWRIKTMKQRKKNDEKGKVKCHVCVIFWCYNEHDGWRRCKSICRYFYDEMFPAKWIVECFFFSVSRGA